MNGQTVFQEELNGAFNRRVVAQPFRVEIQLNTVAQFRDRFAGTSQAVSATASQPECFVQSPAGKLQCSAQRRTKLGLNQTS
jgi:hypothetical protein